MYVCMYVWSIFPESKTVLQCPTIWLIPVKIGVSQCVPIMSLPLILVNNISGIKPDMDGGSFKKKKYMVVEIDWKITK